MSREHRNKSALVGNYVTFFCHNKGLTEDATKAMDRIGIPGPFRISRICSVQFNATGTTFLRLITHDSSASGVGGGTVMVSSGALTTEIPISTSPGNFDHVAGAPDERNIPLHGHMEPTVVNSGGGSVAVGTAAMWITGYFTKSFPSAGIFRESGQANLGGPQIGYYDMIHLSNLEALSGVDVAAKRCAMAVPYDCRAMAVSYHALGHTEVGAITMELRKGGVSTHTPLGVSGADYSVRLDANTGTAWASSAARDYSRGDIMELWLASDNAGDAVPLGTISADVLVWVKGHCRDENAEPTVED